MSDIIPQIPAWILIGFGVFLIGAEMLTATFILLFFGLAFALIGGVSFWLSLSGEVQILSAMLLGAALTFGLRKGLMHSIQSEDLTLETLKTGEIGVIQIHNGVTRVNYKGTSWALAPNQPDDLIEGESVLVTQLENNLASIQKLPDTDTP